MTPQPPTQEAIRPTRKRAHQVDSIGTAGHVVEQVPARDPARTAWIVLLTAFAVFCILAVTVPWGLYRYTRTATAPRMATVEPISSTGGTVLAEFSGVTKPVAGPIDIPEGGRIVTDEQSAAFVQFFEGSNLRLAANTEVVLRRMRAPRWRWSRAVDTLIVEVHHGRITLGAANVFGTPLHYEVHSPHMMAVLGEESYYRVDVSQNETQVVTYEKSYSGAEQAQVQAAGKTVRLGPGQRTQVMAGQPPSAPVGAVENLVADSYFASSLGEVWRTFHDQGLDGDDGVDGQVSVVEVEGRRAVQFFRQGSRENSADVGITQDINEALPDLTTSLALQADLKILDQKVAGGGVKSTEYPVVFRLKYKDAQGSEHVWYHGFYYKPGNLMQNGEQVPRDTWRTYDSGNLLDPETGLIPPPARIVSLEVLASGHDYWSMVSYVRLLVD
ncbi:MAG: hypothetical protein ACE5LU_05375 [Anaerolineae bacterium]